MTYISFDSSFKIDNVDRDSFMSDAASQVAARNATAQSMTGVTLEQVIISNVTSVSSRRARVLTSKGKDGEDVPTSTSAFASAFALRRLQTDGIEITFVTTVTAQEFGITESGADSLFTELTDELAAAVASGSFNTNMASNAVTLGAVAVSSAVAVVPVESNVVSVTTTPDEEEEDDDEEPLSLTYVFIPAVVVFIAVVAGLLYLKHKRSVDRVGVYVSGSVDQGADGHKNVVKVKPVPTPTPTAIPTATHGHGVVAAGSYNLVDV